MNKPRTLRRFMWVVLIVMVLTTMGSIDHVNVDGIKIDRKAVDGLLGVTDSLAYKVHEIEKHFHNIEHWFGLAADADGTHVASEIGKEGVAGFTETGFVITTGNDDWSDNPTLVIGTAETTLFSGVKFDLHRLMPIGTSDSRQLFFVRIGWGTTTAAQAITDGDYTTLPIYVEDTNKIITPVEMLMPRLSTTGINVWMWLFHPNENDKTITFLLGLHEYEG